MALSNTTFDGKLSATINAWLSANYNSLFLANNALFQKLQARGQIKTRGFGITMVEPLMFPVSTGPALAGVSDPYAAVTFTDMTGFTGAMYTAAEYLIPVAIAEYDLDQQGPETAKVDYAEGVVKNAVARSLATLDAALWATEETSGAGGTRSVLASIRALFNGGTAATTTAGAQPAELAEQLGNRAVASATSATPATTLGGIARAAASAGYWATPIINSSDTLTIQVLSSIISKTQCGNQHADLVVMHSNSFDKLMNLATLGGGNGGQMLGSSKLADLGFQALAFRGADIITDDRVPTTCYLNGAATAYGYNIFAINTEYLRIRAKSMKPQLKDVADARPIKAMTGRWLGQLTASNLGRVHARHVNITN